MEVACRRPGPGTRRIVCMLTESAKRVDPQGEGTGIA